MKEPSLRFYISVTGAALVAGTLAAVIVYDPHDWLGFRNLVAIPLAFVGGVAITWQALATGGELLVRHAGGRFFRTPAFWIGLPLLVLEATAASYAVGGMRRQRHGAATLAVARSQIEMAHDAAIFHEPLSEVQYQAVLDYIGDNTPSTDEQVRTVRAYPHSWTILQTLMMNPNVSPQAVDAIYRATLGWSTALDTMPDALTPRQAKERGGQAYQDTLQATRLLWRLIGARASPPLSDEMGRSPNPWVRGAVERRR
jgi:hypothetical protein